MANQYSITVSDNADLILKQLKDSGYKTSQVISAAIQVLGPAALARLVAYQRRIASLEGDEE